MYKQDVLLPFRCIIWTIHVIIFHLCRLGDDCLMAVCILYVYLFPKPAAYVKKSTGIGQNKVYVLLTYSVTKVWVLWSYLKTGFFGIINVSIGPAHCAAREEQNDYVEKIFDGS